MIKTRWAVIVNIQELPIAEMTTVDNYTTARASLLLNTNKSILYGIYKSEQLAKEKAEKAKLEYSSPNVLMTVSIGNMEYEI